MYLVNKNTLADFIRISLKGLLIIETEELKKIGVITGDDWDAFMHGVFKSIGRLNNKELLELITPLSKKDAITPWRNFDAILQVIDMHFEAHPDMHPDKEIKTFLEGISIQKGYSFEWHTYLKRYGIY